MKVTQVAICPTEASNAAGRPALTPELLAASGARYSRNNEGLDDILTKIDPHNFDKSVDSIFKMIDYGHQSIADMVPVSLFIDGLTIWLAYFIWTLCPTAGGQESSTRYIKISEDALIPPELLGIPDELHSTWYSYMKQSFQSYQSALTIWERAAIDNPEVARIPHHILTDNSEKARKQAARMKRNYAFDRARYFLPVAASTNVMMIMSARGWVQLCQVLLSHALPEPQKLGAAIRQELQLCAPRMLRHATSRESTMNGLLREFDETRRLARSTESPWIEAASKDFARPATASLQIMLPEGCSGDHLSEDLAFHDNRYAWIGETVKRTAVRFKWDAVAFAEIRDLNRHRTGTKYCPLVPEGFYSALDQTNDLTPNKLDYREELWRISNHGRLISQHARERLIDGEFSYIYWTLLGTQYSFEHITTADKFIYEAELRTGTGAHYRYAQHLRDVLQLWYNELPDTQKFILEGSAEPE